MNLIELHNKIQNPSGYVIDIGASTGVNSDPVYQFIVNKKFKGLCIEGDKTKVKTLKLNTHFDIYNGYITPENVLDIFSQYKVPIEIDVLKIDIDGYDLEVLRTIMTTYKPKIIIAEINEKIPPPILFEIKYKKDYVWDFSHCFGFSISSGKMVMDKYNYKILSIYELNNILCINQDLCNILNIDCKNDGIPELYKKEYINNLSRVSVLPWNSNINYWLDIKDSTILKNEIAHYFCHNNNRSVFKVKTKVENVDFTIAIL